MFLLAIFNLFIIIKRRYVLFSLRSTSFYTFYRQKSSSTMSNTNVHRARSTPAAEESVNNENLSNYQALNFAFQENPYQSMSR